MTVVRELINLITFQPDEASAKKAEKRVAELKDGMKALSLVAAATFIAAAGAATLAASRINEVSRSAQDAGVGVQEFQGLAAAVKAVSGEAEDVRAGLAELTLRAQEAFEDPGGGMEDRFARYGIAVRGTNGELRSKDELLADVADASKVLEDAGQSSKFLQDELIGDSDAQGLAALLSQGSAGLNASVAEQSRGRFFITDDEIRAAEEFRGTMTFIGGVVTDIATKIGAKLLPPIVAGEAAFRSVLDRNRDLIDSGLDTFASEVEIAFTGVRIAVGAVTNVWNRFSDAVGGTGDALAITATVIGGLAAAFFAVPLAIGTTIAAVVLLADELTAWASGADSLIGRWLGPFDEMPGAVKALFGEVGDVFEEFGALIEGIVSGDFEQIAASIVPILTAPFRIVGQAIAGVIDAAIDGINSLIDGLPDLIKSTLGIEEIEFSASESFTKALGGMSQFKAGVMGSGDASTAQQALGIEGFQRDAAVAAGSQGGASITNSPTTNLTVNVNGGDAEEVRRVVSEAIEENDERQARRMGELMPRAEPAAG